MSDLKCGPCGGCGEYRTGTCQGHRESKGRRSAERALAAVTHLADTDAITKIWFKVDEVESELRKTPWYRLFRKVVLAGEMQGLTDAAIIIHGCRRKGILEDLAPGDSGE